MKRRRALTCLTALAAGFEPFRALGQANARLWRIGAVHGVSPRVGKSYVDAFLVGMKERGYVIGQHFVFDSRWSDGDPSRYATLVDEIVALKPNVLIGANTAVALMMKSRTQTVPIVLATSGDPVGDGLVESLARPGGNVTGVSLQLGELGGKHVELAVDLLPRMRRTAVLVDSSASMYQIETYERLAISAAATKNVQLRVFRSRDAEDFCDALQRMESERPDALVIFLSPRFNSLRRELIEHAMKLRLPSIAHHEGYADDGGLMSYGPSFDDAWRRVSYFVDRILKGAKPSDLPVEQPTKFVLTINLRTAKALGIRIPDVILVRANRLIQ